MSDEPNRGTPDPTPLTTAALQREIAHLKETVFTRIDAMDKAIALFSDNITRVPTDTDKQISHLKELHDEKFTSIDKQFLERDVRVEQTARDSKVAVDAALSAAKEAVGEQNKSSALAISKSEASTTKQIDAIVVSFNATNNGLNDKIDDLRGRLALQEARPTTATMPIVSGGVASNSTGLMAIAASIILAVAMIAVALLLRH